MSNPDRHIHEEELYYLVAKFLENGPCKEAAKVLRKELVLNELIVPRLDWAGNSHNQTFSDYDKKNSHIQNNYLQLIVERLNPLVDRCFPASVKSLQSLLCRGSLSLLRGKSKDIESRSFSWHATSIHCSPLLLPTNAPCTSIVHTLFGRSLNGVRSHLRLALDCSIYSKLYMHKRVLGHLASVYCVLFDQTGSIIVTGADDTLVKVWSAKDARLVATFRGHSAQITDISINKENTFIASGSLDKTIRVWNLRNAKPVAVLQGHTGMITSLQFCPGADINVRYLMSTGGDGNICFWHWYPSNNEFSLTPIKFNEKSRPGAQMLCSSFSPGGSFLVTGSSDNFIRIYQLYPDGPERIAELPNHVDHVDSILYSHHGDRFLSGSRDGTAMVWYYKNSEWHAKCFDATERLPGDLKLNDEMEAKVKLKVTMICWNQNDQFVITAGTDCVLRVWNTNTYTLSHTLKGHTEEIYILEAHPCLPRLILSAGHDGNIIVWDIYQQTKIKTIFNMLEGQGHGAIFDCKFSPDGLMISATDSHGHLLVIGCGSVNDYSAVPYEQFFHTDYRPITRDSNNYVLDEQTQTAPHLMPPPFLVDIDGNPHTANYQMLIPGRNNTNLPQIRSAVIQEDLPPLMAEIAAAEASNLQERQRAAESGLMSPGTAGGLGLRETGDIEGVRQQNNMYISGDITDVDAKLWNNRTIIPKNNLYNEREEELTRVQRGKDEIVTYRSEQVKRLRKPSEDFSHSDKRTLRSARSSCGRGRSRQAKVRTPISYVRAAAMSSFEHMVSLSGREVVNIGRDVVEITESEPEDWQGESSDSTDDSDWTDDRKQPAEVSTRKRRRKEVVSSEAEEEMPEVDEEEVDVINQVESASDRSSSSSSPSEEEDDEERIDGDAGDIKETHSPKRSKRIRGKQKIVIKPLPEKKNMVERKPRRQIKFHKPLPTLDNIDEYRKFYQPAEWLLSVEIRKFPYFPQIGDEVYYLLQGHHLYVLEVINRGEYDIQENRQAYRRYDLDYAELCKLVGISYDVGPPKMCSLKLELMEKKKPTGGKRTVTVRFHDMPNVADFLVLRHIFEESMQHDWLEGDRFRCIIDDSWYYGRITDVSPFQEDYANSSFLSLVVKWDSGDEERLSQWDVEKIPEGCDQVDGTPLSVSDRRLYMYEPVAQDWPYEDLDDLVERGCKGLTDLSSLDFVSPFSSPVDTQQYPSYMSVIAFPTDLITIRSRLQNKFYRRIDALLWEVRQLRGNAAKFNEHGSAIINDAAYLVKLLCKFLKDPSMEDVLAEDNEMTEATNGQLYGDGSEDEEDELETGTGSQACSSSQGANQGWKVEAKSLLDFICSKDDAQPFRQPVDTTMFPDYLNVIQEPIDLSAIRHRLDSNQYENAEAYIRDFQLIFKNSKTYTTDRRSTIFKMTLRLSALFEARCESVRVACLSSNARVHWTRGKKQKHLCEQPSSGEEASSSTRPMRNCKNSSPKKTRIHLNEFVIDREKRQSVARRVSRYTVPPSSDSESEENETPKVRQSKRKVVERKRYGFTSDDEINTTEKKKRRKLSKNSSRSSTRLKNPINYCEDESFEVFEQSSDNSNESASEEEEEPIPQVVMSSRGRIRRTAKRYSDFL